MPEFGGSCPTHGSFRGHEPGCPGCKEDKLYVRSISKELDVVGAINELNETLKLLVLGIKEK
jgi:hypothetical protein